MIPMTGVVYSHNGRGVLELTVEEYSCRKPAQIIFTIDTSDSMDSAAICTDEEGNDVNKGFSNFDINKHAVLTSLEMLSECDYASVVVFSDSASVCVPWTKMDTDGKRTMAVRVRELRVNGGTNFTDCIEVIGTQMCSSPLHDSVNSAVVFYTDGSPTVNVLRRSKEYCDRLAQKLTDAAVAKEVEYRVVGLGIGSKIESNLLVDMVHHFYYIHYTQFLMDATVHMMASILTTRFASLAVSSSSSCTFVDTSVALHPWLSGFTRNLAFVGSIESSDDVRINGMPIRVSHKEDAQKVAREHLRTDAVKALASRIPQNMKTVMDTDDISTELYHSMNEAYMGVNETKYNASWGKHFPHALGRALQLEVKTNELDKALTSYSSRQFEEIITMGCDKFAQITPPVPSFSKGGWAHTPAYSSNPPRQTALPDEFLRGGGCMHADTHLVSRNARGRPCPVSINDLANHLGTTNYSLTPVLTSRGWSSLECISVHETSASTEMRNVEGLVLTAWHPVRKVFDLGSKTRCDDAWSFPSRLSTMAEYTPDLVYNVVTRNRAPIYILSNLAVYEYTTLGHCVVTGTDDPVAYHPFWATEASVDALKKDANYASGLVVRIAKRCAKKQTSGLVAKTLEVH